MDKMLKELCETLNNGKPRLATRLFFNLEDKRSVEQVIRYATEIGFEQAYVAKAEDGTESNVLYVIYKDETATIFKEKNSEDENIEVTSWESKYLV